MASDNNAITLAVVAILATTVGGLLWIIKFLFNKLIPIIENVTEVTTANTNVTKAADKYLRNRNSVDIKQHAELVKSMEQIPKTMQAIADAQAKAIQDNLPQVKEQHVDVQHVDKVIAK